MSDSGNLLRVVDQIYEAATDPSGLAGLAPVLARAFDSESACLALRAIPQAGAAEAPAIVGMPSATNNIDDWAQRAYAEHYHDRDLWFLAGSKKAMPAVLLGQELVDDRTLLRAEWYDFCKKVDAFHLLAAHFPVAGSLAGLFGVHRSRKATSFENSDKRKLQVLLPHLQRALQVNQQLNLAERERGLVLDVLSDLAVGVIVVTGEGRVLFANKVAERTLQRKHGIAVSKGKLTALDLAQKRVFERLMFDAAQTSASRSVEAGGVLTLRYPTGRHISILVSPLRAAPAGFGCGIPAAILIFSNSDDEMADAMPRKIETALARTFGLTPAEACLAAALTTGENLSAYAERRGISLNTAKSQLRHVFAKTGCSRQTDLVRTFCTDSAVRLVLALSG